MKINDSTVNILWNSFLRGKTEAAGANNGRSSSRVEYRRRRRSLKLKRRQSKLKTYFFLFLFFIFSTESRPHSAAKPGLCLSAGLVSGPYKMIALNLKTGDKSPSSKRVHGTQLSLAAHKSHRRRSNNCLEHAVIECAKRNTYKLKYQ